MFLADLLQLVNLENKLSGSFQEGMTFVGNHKNDPQIWQEQA